MIVSFGKLTPADVMALRQQQVASGFLPVKQSAVFVQATEGASIRESIKVVSAAPATVAVEAEAGASAQGSAEVSDDKRIFGMRPVVAAAAGLGVASVIGAVLYFGLRAPR